MLFPARRRWGLLLAFLAWVVPRRSWRRALSLWWRAISGSGLLRALVGEVVPCFSWQRALWVPLPDIPCGCCCFPPRLGGCSCQWWCTVLCCSSGRLLWVMSPAFPGCGLALAQVGAASRLARLGSMWVGPLWCTSMYMPNARVSVCTVRQPAY